MTTQATEKAFEDVVESMLLDAGWVEVHRDEWDPERAVFPARVMAFLRADDPDRWAHLASQHGDGLEAELVRYIVRDLDNKGALHVLRHGFRFQGKTLRIAHLRPAHGMNPDTVKNYERNELTVTRQARCHPKGNDTVDLLFALNGVPVATCELKNPQTGQTWRDAVVQYQKDRDPNAPLFKFKRRALVHFAADPEEVHMATRLAKSKTRFLPFNRGSDPGAVQCGAGNPQDPSGYRTGYFWQEVLQRDRFLDILGSYVFVEKRSETVYDNGEARVVEHEVVVFPRYHQLDAVDRLVAAAHAEGAGRNYLVQHSAGSGKTNTISWLSHRLATLHGADDEKVFDGVVVITDRRALDRHLQEAVYQIDHQQGVVKKIDRDSKQLAQALADKTLIVITTLQKFPFVLKGMLTVAGTGPGDAPGGEDQTEADRLLKAVAGRRYAVIVDEAHSSQTGETARSMKAILGERTSSVEVEDWQDGLNAVVASRGHQPNLSFFAFTATPKGKTIELFGRKKGAGSEPEPFHVYSMRQAIEEGFILDVLRNYTTYKTFFQLVQTADQDEDFPKRRTAVALSKFVATHAFNISQKTEVIIEHFREHIRHRIGGKAKAMVVTSGRLPAVRYMQAFERYIAENKYTDVHALVAFSGTVTDPDSGEDFTEPRMNIDIRSGEQISEVSLPARFESPDYQILLVAEKYQTGFDQPLLQAMYVDKPLGGVQTVQTLSRLNRVAEGKENPFVLDFVNEPADISEAFAPYYDQTQLQTGTDPYHLDVLKHQLDEAQVYHHDEVDAFAEVFYKPQRDQRPADHAALVAALQPAVDRFGNLDEDNQTEFSEQLAAFVGLYAFVSQVISYDDCELERLYSYGRALLRYLHQHSAPIHLGDDVDLEYYRLQKASSGSISPDDDHPGVTSPTAVGSGDPDEEKAPLSEIIERLNERFGTDFTNSERLFLEQLQQDAMGREDIRSIAEANTFEKFNLNVQELLEELMVDRMSENNALVTRYLGGGEFQEVVAVGLLRGIFDAVKAQQAHTEPL